MLATKCVAGCLACGLLGVLLTGGAVRAGDKPPAKMLVMEVAFTGAENLPVEELEQYTSLCPGRLFHVAKANDDCAALLRHYQEHGYPFVTCAYDLTVWSSWWSPLGQVVYTINEGPKVRVQRVEFAGNTFASSAELAAHLESHKPHSTKTNFAAIGDDVARLTEYYRAFGFYDVTVSYELQWNLDGREAVMMFYINEGGRTK